LLSPDREDIILPIGWQFHPAKLPVDFYWTFGFIFSEATKPDEVSSKRESVQAAASLDFVSDWHKCLNSGRFGMEI